MARKPAFTIFSKRGTRPRKGRNAPLLVKTPRGYTWMNTKRTSRTLTGLPYGRKIKIRR